MGDYYITETTQNYRYNLKLIQSISPRQNKPAMSIALPGMSATSNILMQLQGMERTYDITFYLYNDGTDKSEGTAPSGDFPNGVKTVEEQMKWLMDYIHYYSTDAKWKIYGDIFPSTGLDCQIIDISFQDDANTPLHTQATIRITVGQGI